MEKINLEIVSIRKNYNSSYKNDFSFIITKNKIDIYNIDIVNDNDKIYASDIINRLIYKLPLTLSRNEIYYFQIKYEKDEYENLLDLSDIIEIATDITGRLISFKTISNNNNYKDDGEINLDLNSLNIQITKSNENFTNYDLNLEHDNKVYNFIINSMSEKIYSFDILRKALEIIIDNKEYSNGVFSLKLNISDKFKNYIINNSFMKFEVKNFKLIKFNVKHFN